MQIKFLARKLTEYKGVDGKGSILHLRKDQEAEVADHVAALLLKHYGQDFEVILEPKPEHAPKADKSMKKNAQFKSK